MWEAMFDHALLHRIEGDIENARAWYADVAGSGAFEYVWADGDGAETLGERVTEAEAVAVKTRAAMAKEQEQKPGDEESQMTDFDGDASNGTATTFGHAEPGSDDARSKSSALPRAHSFLDRVRDLQKSANKQRSQDAWKAEYKALSVLSEREVRRLLMWLEKRFGTQSMEDASSQFPRKAGKFKEMASKQLVGGEGWRSF